MTYNVSSGTLNTTIPYRTINSLNIEQSWYMCVCVCVCDGIALLEAKFYVIGFEYMVEVVRSLDEVEYPPVEVGIVEWSMGGGISREFHRVINPG